MLFQMLVALAALGVMAFLFAASPDPPPKIVYVVVMLVVVVIAVNLRAVAKHGGDVKVSFRAPPEWFGKAGGPTWMGRPTGDQLGSFWTRAYWRRRKVTSPPPAQPPESRER